jgi:hypothetical protein
MNSNLLQRTTKKMRVALCALALVVCATAIVNVHIVPHTHDGTVLSIDFCFDIGVLPSPICCRAQWTNTDVGWLKTVDQYYSCANNTIQNACVRYILTTIIKTLADNPDRKFTVRLKITIALSLSLCQNSHGTILCCGFSTSSKPFFSDGGVNRATI